MLLNCRLSEVRFGEALVGAAGIDHNAHTRPVDRADRPVSGTRRADWNRLEKAQQPGPRMGSSSRRSRLKLTVVRRIWAGHSTIV